MSEVGALCPLLSSLRLAPPRSQLSSVRDLGGRAFRGLRALSVAACGLADLAGVEALPALQRLDVSHNAIDDLSPLHGHPALSVLIAAHTAVADPGQLEWLQSAPALRELDLRHTRLAATCHYRHAARAALPRLRSLDGRAVAPRCEASDTDSDDGGAAVLSEERSFAQTWHWAAPVQDGLSSFDPSPVCVAHTIGSDDAAEDSAGDGAGDGGAEDDWAFHVLDPAALQPSLRSAFVDRGVHAHSVWALPPPQLAGAPSAEVCTSGVAVLTVDASRPSSARSPAVGPPPSARPSTAYSATSASMTSALVSPSLTLDLDVRGSSALTYARAADTSPQGPLCGSFLAAVRQKKAQRELTGQAATKSVSEFVEPTPSSPPSRGCAGATHSPSPRSASTTSALSCAGSLSSLTSPSLSSAPVSGRSSSGSLPPIRSAVDVAQSSVREAKPSFDSTASLTSSLSSSPRSRGNAPSPPRCLRPAPRHRPRTAAALR